MVFFVKIILLMLVIVPINVKAYCSNNDLVYSQSSVFFSENILDNLSIEHFSFKNISGDILINDIKYGKLDCDVLFKDNSGKSNQTHELLSKSLRFIQYLAVILALVLSTVDFFRVIPTQDKDALMKATKKATIRLGIAILIFFVPLILRVLLELLGFQNPLCGLI